MDGLRIDGVLWIVEGSGYRRVLKPLCPTHHLSLNVTYSDALYTSMCRLECPEDNQVFGFKRSYDGQCDYILNKLDSREYKKIKYLNLDDEAIPIAEDKAKSEDNKYFVTARIMESKVGNRLVIYAGERGKSVKTQIFVEPDIKRLTFDQKDLNPEDVFLKVEAEFRDGTKHSIEGGH